MPNIRSSLIAGVISAIIWILITLVLDFSSTAVWVGALVFLVGTATMTYLISRSIVDRRR
jgi:ABC-type transport system involved in cytochrome c biogenesis permease component